MTSRTPLTRRALLALAGAAGVSAAVAACSGGGTTASRSSSPTPTQGPKVTGVTPAQLPLAGGVTVTLAGTGLSGVKGVTVGGVAARNVEATATKVTFTAPHQAMYAAGSETIALFHSNVTPEPSANKASSGNGSTANDGVSGDTATTTPTATPSATAATATPVATHAVEYTAQTAVDRQLQYAMRYWENYNLAEYGSMNASGGDCANFVSQTLIARGWSQRSDWYSRDAGAAHTATWTYCPSMDPWLDTNAPTFGLTRRSIDDRAKVRIGDIIMWDWNGNGSPDHTTIVSEVFPKSDGTVLIKSVSHNEDGPYRDLDEMITTQHPGGVAWFHSFTA